MAEIGCAEDDVCDRGEGTGALAALRGIDRPLRVLSPDGARTGAPDPPYPADLGPEHHRRMLTDMLVTRRMDAELVHLQRQGQLALYASCLGQEAAQVGVAAAMRAEDWLFPQYRQLGMFTARGVDPVGIAMMWRGAYHGGRGLVEQHCSPMCVVVGANALHATGFALGVRVWVTTRPLPAKRLAQAQKFRILGQEQALSAAYHARVRDPTTAIMWGSSVVADA